MYLPNKYTRIYFQIIESANTRIISGYIEKHHIIPKSLGGTNDKANLVSLTSREHYLCHLLLTKMVAGPAKGLMSYALWGMVNQSNKNQHRHKITSSRLYEYAKTLSSQSLSIERKGKTLEQLHGAEKSKEIKEKYKTRKKRSSPSIEERKKIGKNVSLSWKNNSNPRGFQIKQPEKLCCPCCGKIMDKGNYTKYGHGIYCI